MNKDRIYMFLHIVIWLKNVDDSFTSDFVEKFFFAYLRIYHRLENI
jgi:hypothetical protein